MKPALQAKPDTVFPPAEKPTIYFIGVTTGQSSIMNVFPRWADCLNLGDVQIVGIDCKLHDDPRTYRAICQHIKSDPNSCGALVTTHKIDLLAACRDQFGRLDPWAQTTGEISCISKSFGELVGHAKDPITSGLALEAFLPAGHWGKTSGHCCILGAGGASIALTCRLLDPKLSDRPAQLVVTDRSADRLNEMRHIHEQLGGAKRVTYRLSETPEMNDELVGALPAGSVVINATGLGKDRPGSPLTDAVQFPQDGYAWDFNYRGNLVFLDQARRQQSARRLHVEDGWVYFLHGWTRVIAEVFHVDIPTHGPVFDQLSAVARDAR